MSIWDNTEMLIRLEELRDSRRRAGHRLSFDCFNLKSKERGRVYCSKGKRLCQAKDGSLSLLLVLKGITPKVCKNCKDFERIG